MFPTDSIAIGQVAGAAKGNREKRMAAKTAGDINRIPVGNRRWDRVGRLAGAAPNFLAISQVIASHFASGIDDNLLLAAMLDDQRCGPAGALIARRAPELLTSALIESDNEIVTLMVPVNNDSIP